MNQHTKSQMGWLQAEVSALLKVEDAARELYEMGEHKGCSCRTDQLGTALFNLDQVRLP